jgi:anti-sigma B factor antagonist
MRCSSERQVGDVTILDLSGQQALVELENVVTNRTRSLLAADRRKFVLNMADVSYLDSRGLGDLAEEHQTAARNGAALKLTNVHPRVLTLLKTVNLLKVFDVFESDEDALASFH